MDNQSWLNLLQQYRAIAVIRSSKLELGLAMADAAISGGMKLIEIAWNSDRPERLVSLLRSQFPDCIVGVGTILNIEQLQVAIAAGTQYIFCPHVDYRLIDAAIAAEIPIIPGALSPTEIVTAWHAGASCVKVFPIEAVGGIQYIKSLQGPLGHIPLIPTGGITLNNARSAIEAGAIAIGLSGELFKKDLLALGDWSSISAIAAELQSQFSSLTTSKNFR